MKYNETTKEQREPQCGYHKLTSIQSIVPEGRPPETSS